MGAGLSLTSPAGADHVNSATGTNLATVNRVKGSRASLSFLRRNHRRGSSPSADSGSTDAKEQALNKDLGAREEASDDRLDQEEPPALVTRFSLIKADGLLAKDSAGVSNLLAEIFFNGTLVATHCAATKKKPLSPEWHATTTLHHTGLNPDSEVATVVVYDHDKGPLRETRHYLGSARIRLSRPPGSRPLMRWFPLEFHAEFATTPLQITGKLLLEIETVSRASLHGEAPPWEQQEEVEVPENALREVFWWHKGSLLLTVVRGEHFPKMDFFGLCDPFVVVTLGEERAQTKHLRKTLSPVWNQSLVIHVRDGADMARDYFRLRRTDSAAAERCACVLLEVFDWDVTGNESIGFVAVELYALLDKIARPDSSGIEGVFPVKVTPQQTAELVTGFDGEVTSLTLRFRWELDMAAEAARLARVEAAENEMRRQARAKMLAEERAMQAALERERAEQEAERKAAFLAQLGRDSAAGGDVYSCGAGVFGQHGHGHTKDAGKAPSLVQGAERAVFRRVAAGETSSFYVPELEGDDETDVTGGGAALLLASGSGSFGQLGLIECSVPVAGEAFDAAEDNKGMLVEEQTVPNAVKVLADSRGLSLGPACQGHNDDGASKGSLSVSPAQAPTPRRLGPGVRTVRVREIAAGARHSILVSECGRAFTCGEWSAGALALGRPPPAPRPPLTHCQRVFQEVQGLRGRVVTAGAGDFHSAFVLQEGDVWCAGTGNVGQLGFWLDSHHLQPSHHGGSSDSSQGHIQRLGVAADVQWDLRKIEGLEHIHAVAAGSVHTIFLDQHGVAWACGSGRHGRLGLGHQRDTAPPEPMRGGEAVMVAVSAGRMHSLLLRGDGVALACGNNKFGQLGAAMEHFDLDHLRFYTGGGSTPAFAGGIRHARLTFPGNVMVPVPVWLPPPPDCTVVAISAGGLHSVFLTEEGDVWTCGCNYNGQLGLTHDSGWDEPTPPPSPLPALRGILEVSLASARNLPKMDAFLGTCDAFCEIQFQTQKAVSSVKKNTYSPDWGEIFEFNFHFDDDHTIESPSTAVDTCPLDNDPPRRELKKEKAMTKEEASGVLSQFKASFDAFSKGKSSTADNKETRRDLEIVVRDWDRLSFAEEVGRVKISAEKMEEIISTQIHGANAAARKKKELRRESACDDSAGHFEAMATEFKMEVCNPDGSEVIGENGKVTQLLFAVRLVHLGEPPAPTPPRLLQVQVCCARNLPKMDLFGLADPFVQLAWQGQRFTTAVRHMNLNPDWQTDNQFTFEFPFRQVTKGGGGGDLEITVLDWDKMSAAEEVGRVVVPAEILKKLVLRQDFEHQEAQHEQETPSKRETERIESKEGASQEYPHPSTKNWEGGTNTVQEPEKERESRVLEEESARKASGGIFEVTVNFARHLPKLDLFGSIDGFVELHWRGQRETTNVKKNTFSPDWQETFAFGYVFSPMLLRAHVVAGKDLKAMDRNLIGAASSDPYVVVQVGNDGLDTAKRAQTNVIQKNLNPEWDECLDVLCTDQDVQRDVDVTIIVYDKDLVSDDDIIGQTSLPLSSLFSEDHNANCPPRWYDIYEGSEITGHVLLALHIQKNSAEEDMARFQDSNLELVVKDWDRMGEPELVGNAQIPAGLLAVTSQHKIKPASLSPLGETSTLLALTDKAGKPVIGHDKHQAVVDVSIRILDPPPPALEAFVRVSVLQARKLTAMDRGGTSDPYVKLSLTSAPQNHKRTHVVMKTLSPVWNEDFELASPNIWSDSLNISIFDKDIMQDDKIGVATISLAELACQPHPIPVDQERLGVRERQWHAVQDDRKQAAGEVELRVELVRIPPPEAARQFVVTVVIQRANALLAKDAGGTSDPYCVVQYLKHKHKTKVVKKMLNPTWSESSQFVIDTMGLRPIHPLHISVYDYDLIGSDDLIGKATIDLESILAELIPTAGMTGTSAVAAHDEEATAATRRKLHTAWHDLYEDTAKTKPAGNVLLTISAAERIQFNPDEEKDLSVTSKRGIERLGRGGFFQLVDPSNDSPIMGKDQSHAPGQVGLPATLTSPFSFLRPPFSLFRRDGDGSGMRGESSKGGGSRLVPSVLHVQISLLKEHVQSLQEMSGADIVPALPPGTPQQVKLYLHVLAARGLRAMDRGGTSDPYVTIQVGKLGQRKTSKERKCQTRVVKKNLNPKWDEQFNLSVLNNEIPEEELSVQVWDKDLIGSDDLIGSFAVALASVPRGCSGQRGEGQWHTLFDDKGQATGQVELKMHFDEDAQEAENASTSMPLMPLHADEGDEIITENDDEDQDGASMGHAKSQKRTGTEASRMSVLSPVFEVDDELEKTFSPPLEAGAIAGDMVVDRAEESGISVFDTSGDGVVETRPVAQAGRDELLPRVIASMSGIKVVAVAAGGAHTLLLTSKLARRQRLIARKVLGRVRLQCLTRAWGRWTSLTSAGQHSDVSTDHSSDDVISRVTIVKARDLLAMDRGGTSDPFVEIHLEDAVEGMKTLKCDHVPKTLSPAWNFSFTFRHGHHHHHEEDERVDVVVWDHDKSLLKASKKFMGYCALPLSNFFPDHGVCGEWHDLIYNDEYANSSSVSHNSICGQVYIEIETVDSKAQEVGTLLPWEEREVEERQKERLTRKVVCTILRAEQLLAMDKGGTSDPFVKLTFQSQKTKTKIIPKTINPTFNETFTFDWQEGFGVAGDVLELAVFDHDQGRFFGSSEDFLGSCSLHVLSEPEGEHWHELEFNSKFSNKHYEVSGRVLVDVAVQQQMKPLAPKSRFTRG